MMRAVLRSDSNLQMHGSLVGKILVATSALNGSNFEEALIFVCAHDQDGAFGVIFNHPKATIDAQTIFKRVNVQLVEPQLKQKYTVYSGGPVDENHLFILSYDRDTIGVEGATRVLTLYTNAPRFLLDVASGEISEEFLLCSGMCGWGPLQLEQELSENSWLVTELDLDLIFKGKASKKWASALKKLGIKDISKLVSYCGTA